MKDHFPDISIGVFDAWSEHETIILRRVGIGVSASGRRLRQCRVHGIPAINGERDERLVSPAC